MRTILRSCFGDRSARYRIKHVCRKGLLYVEELGCTCFFIQSAQEIYRNKKLLRQFVQKDLRYIKAVVRSEKKDSRKALRWLVNLFTSSWMYVQRFFS